MPTEPESSESLASLDQAKLAPDQRLRESRRGDGR